MKKQGFTLAEVLVTLGIIGVVAALTTPALVQNIGNTKIGPRLQKAVATFETASEMLLTEKTSNSILAVTTKSDELGKELVNFMKMTPTTHTKAGNYDYKTYQGKDFVKAAKVETDMGARFDSDDGVIYFIKNNGTKDTVNENYSNIANNQGIGEVFVDINGEQGPNTLGKDLFKFKLYNDGTLRAWGGRAYLRSVAADKITDSWKDANTKCDSDGVAAKNNGESCTGSIFDNGMKILYQ